MASGARSSPPGHVTTPSSTETRAKSAGVAKRFEHPGIVSLELDASRIVPSFPAAQSCANPSFLRSSSNALMCTDSQSNDDGVHRPCHNVSRWDAIPSCSPISSVPTAIRAFDLTLYGRYCARLAFAREYEAAITASIDPEFLSSSTSSERGRMRRATRSDRFEGSWFATA